MKTLLVLIGAILFSLSAMAQDTMIHKTDQHLQNDQKNCFMMKNNKMMVMKDGQTSAMQKDVTLLNGITVKTDGTIMKKDGSTAKLKNGECIDMSGNITKMKDKETKKKHEY